MPRFWFDPAAPPPVAKSAQTSDAWIALSPRPLRALSTSTVHDEDRYGPPEAALSAAATLDTLVDELTDLGAELPAELVAVFPRRDALPDAIRRPTPAVLNIDGVEMLACTAVFGPLTAFFTIASGHWVVGLTTSGAPLHLHSVPIGDPLGGYLG